MQRVLITGANKGIGLALVQKVGCDASVPLALSPANVYAAAADLARALGSRALPRHLRVPGQPGPGAWRGRQVRPPADRRLLGQPHCGPGD
eukprot:scaffold1141_cov369-Prasinococcus_capsulatus_cf.AAC.12